jgi:hypothetical protein
MFVYIVIEDNGEYYEDYSEWIDKVFIDKSKAKRYVTKMNKKEKESKRTVYEESHSWKLEEHKIEDIKGEK